MSDKTKDSAVPARVGRRVTRKARSAAAMATADVRRSKYAATGPGARLGTGGATAPHPSVDSLLARLQASPSPRTVDELRPAVAPPAGTNGVEFLIGWWPGDETDDELTKALEAAE